MLNLALYIDRSSHSALIVAERLGDFALVENHH